MSVLQQVALVTVGVSILTTIATVFVLSIYYAGEEDGE